MKKSFLTSFLFGLSALFLVAACGGDKDSSNDSGSGSDEPYEVGRTAVPNCDGSDHGYYVINWSDGSTTYEEY